MKCRACDIILTDREAVAKDKHGVFYDLCNLCLQSSYDKEDSYVFLNLEKNNDQEEK